MHTLFCIDRGPLLSVQQNRVEMILLEEDMFVLSLPTEACDKSPRTLLLWENKVQITCPSTVHCAQRPL
jgi:hypothetical protein